MSQHVIKHRLLTAGLGVSNDMELLGIGLPPKPDLKGPSGMGHECRSKPRPMHTCNLVVARRYVGRTADASSTARHMLCSVCSHWPQTSLNC